VRNAAVPLASLGTNVSGLLLFLGIPMNNALLLWVGVAAFGLGVFFQLVNLPVEFNASSRAKAELTNMGIISHRELGPVKQVLDAAALTYVAATLQSVLTLLYYVSRLNSQDRDG